MQVHAQAQPGSSISASAANARAIRARTALSTERRLAIVPLPVRSCVCGIVQESRVGSEANPGKRKPPQLAPQGLRTLAPRVGFEPTTLRLTAGCSAVELPRNGLGSPRAWYRQGARVETGGAVYGRPSRAVKRAPIPRSPAPVRGARSSDGSTPADAPGARAPLAAGSR